MRRFPSGTTDQYVYFVAVDSTDLKTRETGLTTFTVYRARNGAAAAAYTTPTVAEVSSSNMPGVYSLLLDEDMTIATGNKSEEVVLHITQASMAPVTLVYELYRPDVTDGETLTVSSGGLNAALGTGIITAGSIAADAIGASELAADAATEIATAVWASAARTLTAIDEDNTTLDLDATIRAAVGLATANLDAQLIAIDDFLDTEVAAIKAKTDNLPSDPADASDIAAAFSVVNGTLSAIAGYIDTEVGAIKAKTDNLPSDPADASVVAGLIAAVEAKVDTIDGVVDAILVDTAEIGAAGAGLTVLASAANLATVDTVVDAIKVQTDKLTFTVTGVLDANIHYVNDIEVNGDGAGTPWGP